MNCLIENCSKRLICLIYCINTVQILTLFVLEVFFHFASSLCKWLIFALCQARECCLISDRC